MPELPEVETIRRQLKRYLPLKITAQQVGVNLTPRIWKKSAASLRLKDKSIVKLGRHGKFLIFDLDDGTHLLSHLGMSGAWLISEEKFQKPHHHLILQVENRQGQKWFLSYYDPRRFGHLYHLDQKQFKEKLGQLGCDLVSSNFTTKYVQECFQRYPQRLLKVCLLDQKLFAGSGNYIANEVCARAKIDPRRRCAELNLRQIKRVHQAFADVLNPAIVSSGVTFQGGYQDLEGQKGEGVNHLVVFYQKICQMCQKTEVKKIMLAARGTYYCPRCQK